ncbi:MAG: Trafficking protein particle complex subunit 33 [Peltula sp. TS41687]|nr:MAG: Trafficking protein particle complex subunit 33 [Peltula sp. TS41687]
MSFDTPLPPYLSTTDPQARYLSQTAFDLLLIELVPTISSITTLHNSSTSHQHDPFSSAPPAHSSALVHQQQQLSSQQRQLANAASSQQQLECLGYRVGQGLAERFSATKPRFTETLDVIKFLCKDLWTLCWRKQVDGLKTNHRGVYVLTDNAFRPLLRMSVDVRRVDGGNVNGVPGTGAVVAGEGIEDEEEEREDRSVTARARPFLCFPCGIIRGALCGLGIEATVNAETMELPCATFQIKTIGSPTTGIGGGGGGGGLGKG